MIRIQQLEQLGAPIDISTTAFEHVITTALDMLTGRGFVDINNGLYQANPEAITELEYYANSIIHWRNSSHHG